jgi:hypothetical protein
MKILVACEYSGRVRDSFKAKGHDVISCDILPTERAGFHYQGQVEDFIYSEDWDIVIAFVPCTFICNSGVQWLHTRPGRVAQMRAGVDFFNLFLNHPCERICIENPIPHKYAVELMNIPESFSRQRGKPYSQIIQPWWYGEDASKQTCLWLKNLPLLKKGKKPLIKHRYANQSLCGADKTSPSKTRSKDRALTYWGVARAMADTWGNINQEVQDAEND